MCGQFCIGFIDFMLKGKSLLEYTNLFYSNGYEKSDKIILKYFQQNLNVSKKYRKLKKTLRLSILYSKCGHGYEKIFKEEESIEILKMLDLINVEEYQEIYNQA